MPHTNIICKHEVCLCEVSDPGAFCSGYCKEAWEDNVTEPVCRCGHPNCRQAAEEIGEDSGEDPART
ncbi:hypothetical protein [Dyella jiangningensis]|uniref:Metallothionein n=1 Tax=Dyella jiangningensis TaxID=1379159 RepID=A0A328P2I4_9GAMM|nr:hypothetical protein [Dyella jiangningensis]RAO76199.1 hypothetical protein CA260_10905 [Dyella jiangningensis]